MLWDKTRYRFEIGLYKCHSYDSMMSLWFPSMCQSELGEPCCTAFMRWCSPTQGSIDWVYSGTSVKGHLWNKDTSLIRTPDHVPTIQIHILPLKQGHLTNQDIYSLVPMVFVLYRGSIVLQKYILLFVSQKHVRLLPLESLWSCFVQHLALYALCIQYRFVTQRWKYQ